jgi:transcriptional regulator GlxA family with amidase domain
VQTQPFSDALFDTVIVVGGDEIMPITAGLADYLRRIVKYVRRIGSTCTGTFPLPETRVLNGLHAAAHWFLADEFRARYPDVMLEENKTFVVDGPVWTSAGMTTGMTQALAMVEKDIGAAVVQSVSKNLIVRPWHDASQPESPTLDLTAWTERIQKAIEYAQRNLHKDLSIDELACAAHLSPRQFSRAFKAETGLSPRRLSRSYALRQHTGWFKVRVIRLKLSRSARDLGGPRG